MAVGINIPAANAQYYEAVPLGDTDSALRKISTALGIGAGVTTLFAGALGLVDQPSTAAADLPGRHGRRRDRLGWSRHSNGTRR